MRHHRDDAVMAAGSSRLRRPRRGGRAHCRSRPRAVDAAAAAGRRRPRRADGAPEARPPRSPHARCPRPRRSDHVVVHSAPAKPRPSAAGAAGLELANPISTEMSSMRPGLLPGLLTAVDAQSQSRFRRCWHCSSWGRPIAASDRRISISRLLACAPAPPSSAAADGIGTAPRRMSTCSMPRPTPSRCSPRSASMLPRRRSRATRPPGTTRAAPARCGSDRRPSWRTSARCIRRR